jgi:hypothetical protein
MATLAPSLKLLFRELDAHWPNRDRRTDGWYRPPSACSRPSDHCADSRGRVRAIDIDKDGINPDWVVARLIHSHLPTAYVIWNRHIWSESQGWRKRKYTGTSNPHTDHIHVSIRHTEGAWGFTSGWGVAQGTGGFGQAPAAESLDTDWDFSPQVRGIGDWLQSLGDSTQGYSLGIKGLRR